MLQIGVTVATLVALGLIPVLVALVAPLVGDAGVGVRTAFAVVAALGGLALLVTGAPRATPTGGGDHVPSRAASTLLIGPVTAVLPGTVLLGERFAPRGLFGGVVVLGERFAPRGLFGGVVVLGVVAVAGRPPRTVGRIAR